MRPRLLNKVLFLDGVAYFNNGVNTRLYLRCFKISGQLILDTGRTNGSLAEHRAMSAMIRGVDDKASNSV